MFAIDETTEFGARVVRRLQDEIVVWMTTVKPSGAPLPSPVWFLWDGTDSLLIYSRDSRRIRNLSANPNVTFNFDGNGHGGDIVVLSGTAVIAESEPSADANPAYLEKYAGNIARLGKTPEAFAAEYSVPLRATLTGLRGH